MRDDRDERFLSSMAELRRQSRAGQVVGGANDGQELRELPGEWDAGGGFASLCDEASDAQLIAFLDLLREAMTHRVRDYRRHDHVERALALRNAANDRAGGFIWW